MASGEKAGLGAAEQSADPAENTCVTVDLLICYTGTGSLLSTWGSTELPQASNNNDVTEQDGATCLTLVTVR